MPKTSHPRNPVNGKRKETGEKSAMCDVGRRRKTTARARGSFALLVAAAAAAKEEEEEEEEEEEDKNWFSVWSDH
jgi:hypothetical protein